MVLFTMQCKVVLTLKSANETLVTIQMKANYNEQSFHLVLLANNAVQDRLTRNILPKY